MKDVSCWCGNAELLPFSPGYSRCASCETLLWVQRPGPEIARVINDETEFYGREYWFSHQESELGFPNILERARTDLPERCLHWLNTLLKYKLPPSRVLELGSGPGAFVATLHWAGYEASGLEVSPWVAKFIRETFGVRVLLGPIEDQEIEPASLDAIALMDVLEHLPDPTGTMRHCLSLLKPDGILLIQTPCYPEGRTFEEMEASKDPFRLQLKPTDHLYLFSRRSLGEFFGRLAVEHIVLEPAMFSEYDMCAVASRVPLQTYRQPEIEFALSARPAGRMVQALLDLRRRYLDLRRRYVESEADRAARLDVINRLAIAHGNLQAEVETRRIERDNLHGQIQAQRIEGERLQAEMQAQRDQLQGVMAELRTLRHILHDIRQSRACRLLRRFGRWKFIDSVAGGAAGASSEPTSASK